MRERNVHTSNFKSVVTDTIMTEQEREKQQIESSKSLLYRLPMSSYLNFSSKCLYETFWLKKKTS